MIENKDNIIKLKPIASENKSKDDKISECLHNIIEYTNAQCLLAMIVNQDGKVELVTGSVFGYDVISGLYISLNDLESMSLELANLVAVLKVNQLIKSTTTAN